MADPTNLPLRRATYVKVNELDPNARGFNLTVTVHSVDVVVERKRPDGTIVRIAEALVGDETGAVILTARNEQIALVRACKHIVVRNSKVEMFKNFMRLSVDKWGKITPHPDGVESTPPPPAEVNLEHNLSTVEYECVSAMEGEAFDDVPDPDFGGTYDEGFDAFDIAVSS